MDVKTATVVKAGISVIIGVINSIVSSRRADQQRRARQEQGTTRTNGTRPELVG